MMSSERLAMASHGGRLEVLDSLRGICALMVALHHFKANGILADNLFVENSFLFVDFFFVLSGYVIAMKYFKSLSEGASFGWFLQKRFARLYPLYLAMLIPFLAVELLVMPHFPGVREPFDGPMSFEALGLNVVLLNSMGLDSGLTWNYPGWSIGAEFFTYVGFGAVAFLLGTRVLWVLPAAAVFGLLTLGSASPDYIDATHDLGLVRCVVGFAFGVLLWRTMESASLDALSDWFSRHTATIVELTVLFGVIVFVAVTGRSWINLASPFLFAIAVAVFSLEKGAISTQLRRRQFVFLVTISYSIYLVHAFFASRVYSSGLQVLERIDGLALIDHAGSGRFGLTDWQGNLMTVSYIVLVIVAASMTYRFIEMPGQKLLRGEWGTRPTKLAGCAAASQK